MSKEHILSPEIICRLNNLSLKARFVVEGFIVGLHKSPYHGFSVEFSEHRAYGAGDEIRHIDWKLWGKTDRFFVKQFEDAGFIYIPGAEKGMYPRLNLLRIQLLY